MVALLAPGLSSPADPPAKDARFPIVRDGKVGFINAAGEEVIAPKYSNAGDLAYFGENGLAAVTGPEGSGYIDVFKRREVGR